MGFVYSRGNQGKLKKFFGGIKKIGQNIKNQFGKKKWNKTKKPLEKVTPHPPKKNLGCRELAPVYCKDSSHRCEAPYVKSQCPKTCKVC